MYKITDLYISAYLKSIGFECNIEKEGKRCFFIFPLEAAEAAKDLIRNSSITTHNVNAISLINEIKQLKAYVNNV